MADKGGLQLLPETRRKIDVKIPGENRLIYIGSALLALVLVLYGGLFSYAGNLENKISDIDNQLIALEKQRNKQAEQALLTLSKQIETTSRVFQNHVYWSSGLGKIESALQPNVQFKSLSSTLSDASMRIRGITDNYATIARQISAFVADDAIKDFSLDGVTVLTTGKLDFSAKITFDRSKFLKAQ